MLHIYSLIKSCSDLYNAHELYPKIDTLQYILYYQAQNHGYTRYIHANFAGK